MSSRSGLQYLELTAQDEFGTSVDIPTALDRREVKTFISGGAIVSGDWVMLDTSVSDSARALTVVQALGLATGCALTVGVAIEAASAAGEKVEVVTRGYVEDASVAAAVAGAGIALMVGIVGGDALALTAAARTRPCGVSLEASAAGTADVYVYGIDS